MYQKRTDGKTGFPAQWGLYDPGLEKDACGVGLVANIKGEADHSIMQDAARINSRMDHRSGCGFERNTGDGTGILTAMPHKFFKAVYGALGITLPGPRQYAIGNIFLPQTAPARSTAKDTIARIIQEEEQTLLGWRELPIAPEEADVGPAALAAMPRIEQLAIGSNEANGAAFERILYLIRKRFTQQLREDGSASSEEHLTSEEQLVYACSLNSRVIVYKGMLTPRQLFPFYPDLEDPGYESHLAMVHSRFSTNTFPSWDRAQPNRFMCHNGEINTLRGNVNLMTARQGVVKSALFGDKLPGLFPIVEPHCADSGTFDNVLEFLLMSGRTLQEAIMLMIPEAWQGDLNMPAAERAFYEYNSALMEPWDGPASIVFTDGKYVGAVLDRNGLRPSRYYITHDDKVIMASEVGVLPIPPEQILHKGRLQPGRMFLIDFEQGRMIPDEEIKSDFAKRRPYKDWLAAQKLTLADLPETGQPFQYDAASLVPRMQAFGYTIETLQFMLLPLVTQVRDPLGSMGNDAALACMSDSSRMIYDYFKQLFAQITNPAIDSIREEIVMSLACFVGPEGNLLAITEAHARRLHLEQPILSNEELARIKNLDQPGWKTRTIDTRFDKAAGKAGMLAALSRICAEASAAIDVGCAMLVLSDRGIDTETMALSSLLACGAVHHHLVATHQRTRIGIVIESGEAREVHHHCLLIGYGADAINPYLAFEALWQAREDGLLNSLPNDLLPNNLPNDIAPPEQQTEPPASGPPLDTIINTYKKAVGKGILKVMAKMGISTLQSYKGAQIFEAVGLADEIIQRCFVGTASRIQGVAFDVLFEEMQRRHEIGFPVRNKNRLPVLPNPGDIHWRHGGDTHMWDPQTIATLQVAARNNNAAAYWQFARHANQETTRQTSLRGLLRFRESSHPVPLDEVVPGSSIVKRFCTGAMSFGSISAESHAALAIAMNRIGGKSNTGEGGEDPERFKVMPSGDSQRSAIKQVASGRFGVTIWYLTNADELQIKIVQGAKPGEGGELPGGKVDDYIAKLRYSTPGVGLISPPPHHDVYSIEDIAQLIHDLKNSNPEARISVKLGSEIGVGTIAAGVTKAKADHLVISGHDGGTGASPLTSIKHAGLPWELGLAETHQTLVMNNLRSRVILQADGQIKTGRDVAIALLLGAEEIGFATAPLVTLGCIMMRKCHLNTCPVGIATQDPELRKKFSGSPEHLVNYFFMVAEELRQIMAKLGIRTIEEMIGRVDLLDTDKTIQHWKAKGLDFTRILTPAKILHADTEVYCTQAQEHGLEAALDKKLIELAQPALSSGKPVKILEEVHNTNRVVGTMLSHEVAKATQGQLLPDDTINIKLNGSAGQSLGAWLAKGITIEVEGDANDYVGKGLSGGKLIIYPPKASSFAAEDNILIGNVALYGATSGEAYFRGIAAERFCVRNSGASAVIEGLGDHGCEYMTGGRVVILGATGRNFGAGMSGGIAYVWDKAGNFASRCNLDTLELEAVTTDTDIKTIRQLIENHLGYTGSVVAQQLLSHWQREVAHFVKVMPTDYKRVLELSLQAAPEEPAVALPLGAGA